MCTRYVFGRHLLLLLYLNIQPLPPSFPPCFERLFFSCLSQTLNHFPPSLPPSLPPALPSAYPILETLAERSLSFSAGCHARELLRLTQVRKEGGREGRR